MIRPKEVMQTNEIVCDHCNTIFLYDDTDITYGEYGTKGFTCPDCGEWIAVDWDRHLPPTYPTTFSHNNGVPLSDEEINKYVQEVVNALKDKEMKAGEFATVGCGDTMVIGLKFEDEEDIYVLKNYWEDIVV